MQTSQQDIQNFLQNYLATNPNSRANIAFVSAITLAYRSLYEQSDSGTILTPEQFVELLLAGAAATRLEASVAILAKLAPRSSPLDKDKLVGDFALLSIQTILAEETANAKLADLLAKLLNTKGTLP